MPNEKISLYIKQKNRRSWNAILFSNVYNSICYLCSFYMFLVLSYRKNFHIKGRRNSSALTGSCVLCKIFKNHSSKPDFRSSTDRRSFYFFLCIHSNTLHASLLCIYHFVAFVFIRNCILLPVLSNRTAKPVWNPGWQSVLRFLLLGNA